MFIAVSVVVFGNTFPIRHYIVLIHIFLITSDVENLFICLLVNYTSSLKKHLFKSLSLHLDHIALLLSSWVSF